MEEEKRQQLLAQYQLILKQKQEMERLKEQSLMEIGEAHKKAMEQETLNKENQQLNQQKLKKFNEKAKDRAVEAIQAVKKEKYDLGGYKQDIVKKKQDILEQESKRAHDNAELFRTL